MLGKRSVQRGMFEADHVFGDFVGRETFYGFLASQRGELFRDEDFAILYCATNGRPSVSPGLLATALVLQTFCNVSDDEATQRATYDLRWKVALGIEMDSRPFAKSTLQEFRAQLIVQKAAGTIFQESLEAAKRHGYFRRERKLKLALDTSNILGRGAVKDTYHLLADGILAVLRILAGQAGQELGPFGREQGYGRYVSGTSLKGQVELDWSDDSQRRSFLQEIVADADRLLEAVRVVRGGLEPGSLADTELAEAAGVLSRVLGQDIERRPDGAAIREGVAPDRLVSVHDPEMRHGRKSASKRFDGHKCALATDTDDQFITAVAVTAGNAPDDEAALDLVKDSEQRTGCEVEEVYGDCAFGDGETRQAFAEAGQRLIAKVPACTNRGRFPKTAFALDLDKMTCTCPAGEVTRTLRTRQNGDQGAHFAFPAAVCAACPLREQCIRGSGGRAITLHPQEALLQEARRVQASPAFQEVRRRRQTVEHRIARCIQLGLRQARYFGRTKTLFQVLLTAAVANLTLLANLVQVG